MGRSVEEMSTEWIAGSKQERGHVLRGDYGHWCAEWDGLTVDESCDEFHGGPEVLAQRISELRSMYLVLTARAKIWVLVHMGRAPRGESAVLGR